MNNKIDVLYYALWFGAVALISGAFSLFAITFRLEPKPLQNVVCDTSYGVQYFEHKGILTLRVNHEGVPIRCYE